ncbi:NAD(P)/FAD-dependent oxidoreductase [Fusobacterium pseudoperiodonticum]|uniref:NAD(P)/FAD-dependent oxidoreductase n=1 Tax=Fusobacterium pseudoperiodonticum TaxID=2663009 RepID=UPI000C1B0057|nr:NAD(P)/FAD-dependent oxidoreductase [Fusobacterium pseudoperiodonticum]ATV57878.1 thioredoxin reductase [Fusobacterium pseudoperiodonticum]PIM77552.1 thioredoxin reductase [Fusobacterium pseudoperiodonticum]
MEKIYDVVIVGAGPAGLTAGIYTGRGNLSTLILEKEGIGSMIMTHQVDNYPGSHIGASGKEIYDTMKKQALDFGCEIKPATVLDFDPYDEIKIVKTDAGNFKTRYIIIATGLGKIGAKKVKGENKFLGAGVSYCATCDGAFTKGRTVSLVGKGDELIEESLFLTRYAKEVNVFLTSDDLDCSEELKEAILSKENVKIVKKVKLLEIKGEDFVTELDLEVDGNKETVATDFVFLYLGTKNNLELYGEFVSLSDAGYIVTDETMKTRTDKMYAIGDIREKDIRQIATATNDGVIAASFIMKEILKAKKK